MHRSFACHSLLLAGLFIGCSVVDAEEAERIVEVLALEPGMTVADVGAGDGEWSLMLAEAVGANGIVYATEVEDDLVEKLGKLGRDEAHGIIVALRGNELSTGLGSECCDAILLRMVYHHFTNPQPMRESIRAALRPGGRIAIIDIEPQSGWRELDGVPDRGGHGIPLEGLVAEMVGAGFEVEAVYPEWRNNEEERYCVVFTSPASDRSSS